MINPACQINSAAFEFPVIIVVDFSCTTKEIWNREYDVCPPGKSSAAILEDATHRTILPCAQK